MAAVNSMGQFTHSGEPNPSGNEAPQLTIRPQLQPCQGELPATARRQAALPGRSGRDHHATTTPRHAQKGAPIISMEAPSDLRKLAVGTTGFEPATP